MKDFDFDYLCVHLVETTASSGVKFQRTTWAAVVQYILSNRALVRKMAMHTRAIRTTVAIDKYPTVDGVINIHSK